MINAIIFDLDSCLAAADEVGEQLFAPAFQAIRKANRGAVSQAALAAAFIQILRPGVPASPVATHHIRTLAERSRFL